MVLTLARALAAWPVPTERTLLHTGVSSEARGTGAGPLHGVTGGSIMTLTLLGAVFPEEATGASFTAVGPCPSSFAAAASLRAEPVLATVGGATVQLITGSTPPEVPRALAAPLHTGPVAAAVWWLAAGLMHTHHGGHAAGTAPHVVLAVIRRVTGQGAIEHEGGGASSIQVDGVDHILFQQELRHLPQVNAVAQDERC